MPKAEIKVLRDTEDVAVNLVVDDQGIVGITISPNDDLAIIGIEVKPDEGEYAEFSGISVDLAMLRDWLLAVELELANLEKQR